MTYYQLASVQLVLFLLQTIFSIPGFIQNGAWWAERFYIILQWIWFIGCPVAIIIGLYMTLETRRQLRVKESTNPEIADVQPLQRAVRFVMEQTEFGRRKTEEQVLADICRLGAGGNLVVQGRKGKQFAHMIQSAEDCHDKIPAKFLETCTIFRDKNKNIWSLIEHIGPEEVKGGKIIWSAYFEPRVSMQEIRYHYPSAT